jgi:hypothetical protein
MPDKPSYTFEQTGAYESELGSSRGLRGRSPGTTSRLDVAPDGAVCRPDDQGLARFDGETWDWYLRNSVVQNIDTGEDGMVWVQAHDLQIGPEMASGEQEGTTSTYVITP